MRKKHKKMSVPKKPMSEETKLKLSDIAKKRIGALNNRYGKKQTDYQKEMAKKAQEKQVMCIDTNKIYNSMKDASLDTGVNISKISLCCSGKRKRAGGLTWRLVDGNK